MEEQLFTNKLMFLTFTFMGFLYFVYQLSSKAAQNCFGWAESLGNEISKQKEINEILKKVRNHNENKN
jgi:hypothetical protein